MKRILLSTSLALALSSSLAIAQQPDTTPAPTAKVHHHHTRNPQREAARLSKKLNLSADQTAKLEPILVDRDSKIAALTSDTSISPVAMKQQIRAIRQQTRQQLATVLTPDQLQQLKAHHHRRGQESPDQAQPQPNPQSSL